MKTVLRRTAILGLLAATTAAVAQPPAGGGRAGPGGPAGAGRGGAGGGRGRGGMNFGEPTLLTFEQANQMMAAAEKYASDKGWGMSIRITDHNHVTLLARWVNNASPMVINITNMKAKAVTATKMSSAEYGAKLAAGEIEAVEGAVNFGGGLPIYIDGQFVGAIAASGGSVEEDTEVAQAGIDAIGASSSM